MFKAITIEGFRGITQVSVNDFGRVNVIVGKNNCGKTTLLEALFFSLSPTNIKLFVQANAFRALTHTGAFIWNSYFNKSADSKRIVIESALDKPEERRRLVITPLTRAHLGKGMKTGDEYFELVSNSRNSISSSAREILGLAGEFTSMKKGSNDRTFVSKIISRKGGWDDELPQNYEETRNGVFLTGSLLSADLAQRFERIQIQKEMDWIVKILRGIEPSLKSLSLGTGGIIYGDIGLDTLIPVNCMGNGFHKLLSVALALYDMKGGIVLIDEVENGFHYSSLNVMWDMILATAHDYKIQVFATTHSLECVKAFNDMALHHAKIKENKLYRMEKDKEKFFVTDYDLSTLSASLESEWEVR
ncbi:MAG: ATP/GTP-binding protein [Candidatus Xenobiia bacterium LiM19]